MAINRITGFLLHAEGMVARLAHKEGKVSTRTLANGPLYLNLYVLPSIGRRKLGDLMLREIDLLYATMQAGKLPAPENAPGWRGKPLSARTMQMAHGALTQAEIYGTFSLYCFSHTFATLHLASGIPLKVVRGAPAASRNEEMASHQRGHFHDVAVWDGVVFGRRGQD